MRITAADIARWRRTELSSVEESDWDCPVGFTPHPAAIPPLSLTALGPWTPIAAERLAMRRLGTRRYRLPGPNSAAWPLPAMLMVLDWPPPATIEPVPTPRRTEAPPAPPVADEPVMLEAAEVEPYAEPEPAPYVPDAYADWSETVVEAPQPVPPLPEPHTTVYRAPFEVEPEPEAAEPDTAVWDLQPVSGDEWLDEEAWLIEPVAAPRPKRGVRWVRYALAAAAAGSAITAAVVYLRPGWSQHQDTALFNAPMMVVKAAAPGRVATISVSAGQAVTSKSPLLSLQNGETAGPPVLAGVNGIVRSVEIQAGADVVRGSPLVRLYDCDHGFLTLPSGSKIAPGETTMVTLAGQPPFKATARNATGVAEPANAVVVGLPPGAVTAGCPVGATATVRWDDKPT